MYSISAGDQEQLATGKDVKVILKVKDISASVSAEDKKQIVEKLATQQQNTADTALLYIDISLFKKVGDARHVLVHQVTNLARL